VKTTLTTQSLHNLYTRRVRMWDYMYSLQITRERDKLTPSVCLQRHSCWITPCTF